MTTFKHVLALGGCMLFSAAGVVQADTTQGSNVEAELSAMRSRIAQLEGQQNQSWLNERRAEEVKSLVREVLSDADTRASLADGGMSADMDENGTHITSADGRFALTTRGQIQFRYTYNIREGTQAGTEDKNDGFFSTPRMRLIFEGHIADPRLHFYVALAAKDFVASSTTFDADAGFVFLEEYSISYDLADGFTIWAGRVTSPLVRGDMIDSSRTLAADRSVFSNFYTSGRPDGIGMTYFVKDSARVMAQFFDGKSTEFGFVGRVDFKVMGEWDQFNDFNAWAGEGQGLVFGLSGQYSEAAHGRNNGYDAIVVGVADVLFESNGLSLYLAGAASNSDDGSGHFETYGILMQGAYMFVPDKFEAFGRYEYIALKDSGSRDPNLFTVGVNYYLARHNAKLTADMQYAPRGNDGTDSLGGLLDDQTGNRNQVAFRFQIQLLF